jgi:hypothetical protein
MTTCVEAALHCSAPGTLTIRLAGTRGSIAIKLKPKQGQQLPVVPRTVLHSGALAQRCDVTITVAAAVPDSSSSCCTAVRKQHTTSFACAASSAGGRQVVPVVYLHGWQ